jgi:hypothetical protein
VSPLVQSTLSLGEEMVKIFPPHQLSQSLVNATTFTYHNFLTVRSSDVEDYIGSFSCNVSNNLGNSQLQSLDINSKLGGNMRKYSALNIVHVYTYILLNIVLAYAYQQERA